jgi:hypothetical protein
MTNQIPNSKLQITNKFQTQMTKTLNVWNFVFEIYLLFGACNLEFVFINPGRISYHEQNHVFYP